MTALRETESLLKLAKEVSRWLRGEKQDSLRLDCMNGLGVYTTTVTTTGAFAKWVRRIGPRTRGFPLEEVYDVRLYGLKPSQVRLEDAITREHDRIVADLTKILDYDMFRMEVFYRMDKEWLEGLVRSRSSPEPFSGSMRYHLSAQLTDPDSLGLGFSEVDVEEFPVTARVQIQEDINTQIPVLDLIRRLRAIDTQLLADYDPHHVVETIRLKREKAALKERIMRRDPTETIRDLMLLLRPTHFISYLRTEEDFRMHDCAWGADLFEMLGSISLPKAIEATARTDLSLADPAAKGDLVYESGQFSQDIAALVERGKVRGEHSG